MTEAELKTKFDKFLSDNNGKFIERVDSNALNQCFDLAIYWCEYLGFPKSIYSGLLNAYQIYTQWSNPAFEKIANDATFVPQKGDTIVWSGSKPGTGGAGHVAVATGVGDVNTFQAFSQNDPTGSPSVLKTYNYSYVLGVQRLKVTSAPMNDKRPYWFDLLSKTEFGTTGWEKLTDAQINKWVTDLIDRKVAAGKWDKLCDKAGLKHTVSEDEVIKKLSVCTPAELAKSKEEGRKAGVKQVDEAVHKLL